MRSLPGPRLRSELVDLGVGEHGGGAEDDAVAVLVGVGRVGLLDEVGDVVGQPQEVLLVLVGAELAGDGELDTRSADEVQAAAPMASSAMGAAMRRRFTGSLRGFGWWC